MTQPKTGLLLANLGSPRSPQPRDVRDYLREFLSDPRVIEMPAAIRWLWLRLVILPRRPRVSGKAYESIWTERGSPLISAGEDLRDAVAAELGASYTVELAMRYGAPSLSAGMEALRDRNVERIVVFPLYPQSCSATTHSTVEAVLAIVAAWRDIPSLSVVGPFFDAPEFIAAFAHSASESLATFQQDHLLFSFHGLPESQVRGSDRSRSHCLVQEGCCERVTATNQNCYRAQCYATARALARAMELETDRHSVSFQSRLGRIPWIQPYTDEVLPKLAEQGIKRLAVMCPAFVADCLETLEEIGIRAREQWLALGGDDLLLVPCLNADPPWARVIADWTRSHAARPRPVAILGSEGVAASRSDLESSQEPTT